MNDGTGAAPVAGLADLISQVRSELAEAQRRIGDSTLRLSVERVTLEIAVQVSREAAWRGEAADRCGHRGRQRVGDP